MRRKNLEITDYVEIIDIIDRCDVLRLGMVDDDGAPYIVPLNFGYTAEDGVLTFYFHSAPAGRKIGILKKNPRVCFEMETSVSMKKADIPCKWTSYYESVMGGGVIVFLEDDADKEAALANIMHTNGFMETPEFTPAVFARTLAYRLDVEWLTAKSKLPHP